MCTAAPASAPVQHVLGCGGVDGCVHRNVRTTDAAVEQPVACWHVGRALSELVMVVLLHCSCSSRSESGVVAAAACFWAGTQHVLWCEGFRGVIAMR